MYVDPDKLCKAINFDLEAKRLKEELGVKNPYPQLRKFFKQHGFKHTQG